MSFEVRMKKRTKMIVLRIFSALMAAVMIWFINLDSYGRLLCRMVPICFL